MRRLALSMAAAALLTGGGATTALAHDGGHRGGCEEFGHVNRAIGEDPAAFGFAWADSLGDIVSWFAGLDDAAPGVGDIVATIDHAACG